MADSNPLGGGRRPTARRPELTGHASYPDPGQPSSPSRPISRASSRDSFRNSIRIRRLPSVASQRSPPQSLSRPTSRNGEIPENADSAVAGRRRSFSAPQRYTQSSNEGSPEITRQRTLGHGEAHMQTISEAAQAEPISAVGTPGSKYNGFEEFPGLRPTQPSTPAASRLPGRTRSRTTTYRDRDGYMYDDDVVDLLDLVDPEVRAIGTLNNLQNSLFIPDLGGLINRHPTYDLTPRNTRERVHSLRSRAGTRRPVRQTDMLPHTIQDLPAEADDIEMRPPRRTISIDSRISDSRFAVLPHGVTLDDWTDEDLAELDDHVRHLLHSRREGFKRSMRGFRKYLSRPLGLFVFVYATLVTLFGAAWVFFLIGWIYVGSRDRRDYITDVIDNVLVALFALIGDGLAPFRAVDTYHMFFIAHYHRLTWRLRQQKNLPKLVDRNDLPVRRGSVVVDENQDKQDDAEFSVLTARQQRRLQYHQAKFSKAHTFYRPHETATHHAFPLHLLVAIVVLLDCHSILQIALGTCTWSIDYKVRPEALTATILSVSITSNIMAGVLISIGDRRTRKKEVLERIFRQGLTEEAIRRVQKKHMGDDVGLSIDAEVLEQRQDDDVSASALPEAPTKLISSHPQNSIS